MATNNSAETGTPPQDAEPDMTALAKPPPDSPYPPPPFRRLRAFAFDPLLSTQLDTLEINQVTLPVLWEKDLQPGPVGEYLEVVDYDPPGNCFYDPVNLNDRHLLASDGLVPSEANPQFHQQMVYAVAMTTIRHFELALGRKALWSPRRYEVSESGKDEFVQRLRVYPHGLREANAYYSPDKKALLFGYFPSSDTAPGKNLPGGIVFTCLSHDIIAHETTHALLDGMHLRFIEASNPDMPAFHEAFADLVAMLQHFTFPDVLKHQIARTGGDLTKQNLLGELAQQFGEAIGNYGALRSALGHFDPETQKWVRAEPDPIAIQRTLEPHARGAILVATVFDAFLAIYRRRVADLLRIATGGSGILPAGQLHPDLVNRLAETAAKSARHVLWMCIRALDYCPPIDMTFGEYLRALITADAELVDDDDLNYRVAMTEAFRSRGLFPPGVRSLAPDSLVWQGPEERSDAPGRLKLLVPSLEKLLRKLNDWNLSADRKEVFQHAQELREFLHGRIVALRNQGFAQELEELTGLALTRDAPRSIERGNDGYPKFEVHAARPARRVGPDGQLNQRFIVEVMQKRAGYRTAELQDAADKEDVSANVDADFTFRGGATLVFDLETAKPKYLIGKSILNEDRLQRQREFLMHPQAMSLRATYFGTHRRREPFALLHRDVEPRRSP